MQSVSKRHTIPESPMLTCGHRPLDHNAHQNPKGLSCINASRRVQGCGFKGSGFGAFGAFGV